MNLWQKRIYTLFLAASLALPLAACTLPRAVTSEAAPIAPVASPPALSGGRVTAMPAGKTAATAPALLAGQPLIEIPLAGPAARDRSELSGMAWYGDHLVLLPQYPQRWAGGDGAFFVLERSEIEDFLAGRTAGPLTPRLLPVDAPGLRAQIPGYEGFESITFDGERVYLTVEASPTGGMMGWLLAGRVEADLGALHIDAAAAQAIPPQATIGNMSDEAIVLAGGGEKATLLTFYEANGRLVNPRPIAHRFAADLTPLSPLAFPALEYRLTDATAADELGRFWAINYFYPGDVKLKAGKDALLRRVARALPQVERLVELRITGTAIQLTGVQPIYLKLLDEEARNWEGIVRLGDQGFLLVTDTYPRTILAFVAKP